MTSAFNQIGSKYLPDAVLYVTVEPCLMCCGAMYWAKIGRIVYGAEDVKNGYKKTTGTNWPFHQKAQLTNGVLAAECGQLMKDFFAQLR
jgi:tRNA(adenine34) deaminase